VNRPGSSHAIDAANAVQKKATGAQQNLVARLHVRTFADQVDAIMRAVESQAELTPTLEEAFSMTHDPRRAAFQGKVHLQSQPPQRQPEPWRGWQAGLRLTRGCHESQRGFQNHGGRPAEGWGMDGRTVGSTERWL